MNFKVGYKLSPQYSFMANKEFTRISSKHLNLVKIFHDPGTKMVNLSLKFTCCVWVKGGGERQRIQIGKDLVNEIEYTNMIFHP